MSRISLCLLLAGLCAPLANRIYALFWGSMSELPWSWPPALLVEVRSERFGLKPLECRSKPGRATNFQPSSRNNVNINWKRLQKSKMGLSCSIKRMCFGPIMQQGKHMLTFLTSLLQYEWRKRKWSVRCRVVAKVGIVFHMRRMKNVCLCFS